VELLVRGGEERANLFLRSDSAIHFKSFFQVDFHLAMRGLIFHGTRIRGRRANCEYRDIAHSRYVI